MSLQDSFGRAKKSVKSRSPELLTGAAVAGVLSTSYLTARATVKAVRIVDHEESIGGVAEERKQRIKERARLVWRVYIPPAVSGVATATFIVMGSKAQSRRTAAAVTAYSVLEKGFSEYRDKVVEEIGEGKEQKIRDILAEEKVQKNPQGVIIAGSGDVLCCELYTDRYFKSDMETLRRAQNDINAKIISDLYVTMDEFYSLVGLGYTSVSGNTGWNSDKMLELEFSSVISSDGTPCLAFDYNYVKAL